MNSAEAVFILVGADVLFNRGEITTKIISSFHDVLKVYYSQKNATYAVSQEDLVDAGFGC